MAADKTHRTMDQSTKVATEPLRRQRNLDGGYAWVILAACFLYFLIQGFFTKTQTLIYPHIITRFSASATEAGMVSGIHGTVKMFSSPVVGLLLARFGSRPVSFAGALLWATGVLLTAVAPSLTYVYVFYSIIAGVGSNVGVMSSIVMLGSYFDARKSRAMAVAMSGLSLGTLGGAPLLNLLLHTYGFSGALLIQAGIILNACVSAALSRPFEDNLPADEDIEAGNQANISHSTQASSNHNTHHPTETQSSMITSNLSLYSSIRDLGYDGRQDLDFNVGEKQSAGQWTDDYYKSRTRPRAITLSMNDQEMLNVHLMKKVNFDSKYMETSRDSCHENECTVDDYGESIARVSSKANRAARVRNRTQSVNIYDAKRDGALGDDNGEVGVNSSDYSDSKRGVVGSDITEDVVEEIETDSFVSNSRDVDKDGKGRVTLPCCCCCCCPTPSLPDTTECLGEGGLMRSRAFLGQCLLMMTMQAVLMCNIIFMGPLATEACGMSEAGIAHLLSVSAFMEIPAKNVSGVCFDLKWIKHRRCAVYGLLCLGVGLLCATAVPLAASTAGFTAAYIGFIMLFYFFHSQTYTVLSDVVGPARLGPAMGLMRVTMGLGTVTGTLALGVLKDRLGRYSYGFHLCGALFGVGAVTFLALSRGHQRRSGGGT